MTKRVAVCLCLVIALAACVAPEEQPIVRNKAAASARPAISSAGFEDAPTPNRKLGAPASDSVIRMAR